MIIFKNDHIKVIDIEEEIKFNVFGNMNEIKLTAIHNVLNAATKRLVPRQPTPKKKILRAVCAKCLASDDFIDKFILEVAEMIIVHDNFKDEVMEYLECRLIKEYLKYKDKSLEKIFVSF